MLFNRYEVMVRVAPREERSQERPVCARCKEEVKSGEWIRLWMDLKPAGVTKLSPVCAPCDMEIALDGTLRSANRGH